MNNLHAPQPKINFLKLQMELKGSEASTHIYLFAGTDVTQIHLSECKNELEALAPANVKVFTSGEDSNSVSNEVRKIGIALESKVTFESTFLENLLLVFMATDTFCLYSDFYHATEEGQFEKKLPAWSPIRFASVDYLGPMLAFDITKYMSIDESNLVTRGSVIDFARANNLRISRVPQSLYKSQAQFPKCEIQTDDPPFSEKVSIVIPTRGLTTATGSLLENCVRGITRQLGIQSIELIVVADEGYENLLIDRVKENLPRNISFKVIEFNESFNFSRKCNLGATQATGKVIVFLNDDVELHSCDAIAKLSSWTLMDGVGAVGSQLQFTDGSIQHAGITLENVKPRNSYLDQFPRVTDFGDLEIAHEVSGVTGACLAVKREVLIQAGGWNEDLPNSYNDVDLCLRLNSMGFQSVVLNHLKIIHNESSSRNAEFDLSAFENLKQLWPDELSSERYLRSADANGEYEGPWGCHRVNRLDFSGNSYGYAKYLIATQGVWQLFKVVFRRLTGKTQKALSLTRKEYL